METQEYVREVNDTKIEVTPVIQLSCKSEMKFIVWNIRKITKRCIS